MQTKLAFFEPSEFHHFELVDPEAGTFLDDVRRWYGKPLVITSDARTPAENAAASGSSPTSLHLLGRAFDLKWIADPADLWAFVEEVLHAAETTYPGTIPEVAVELELVNSKVDQHIHLGLFPQHSGKRHRLLIRAD